MEIVHETLQRLANTAKTKWQETSNVYNLGEYVAYSVAADQVMDIIIKTEMNKLWKTESTSKK